MLILIVLCANFFIKALPYLLISIALTYAFIYWRLLLIVAIFIGIYFFNKRTKKE
ncbi:conserved membrane protein of unknown function [Oenococcus oeni]|uniref:Uncharacterized protein n=1 Tax=Oenococcus oeni TaxID=1247 RepID=A0AAQ2URE5_OENOE|nr:hypothetical protein AWRIB548_282 [Oenococcus oeni AWRIB548]SYW06762.1 conserved membrane hypothetical protein [Oenococcus oeni]SYW08323.1 conserved membrane hypothetical protein [Oenococcus oeni]SYW10055.1 conserved membrane hypothetical protein [Oenococcus oeni]SYW11968.1 conserved membrane hypothetical protein [Oenococcus oeni]